MLVTPKSTESFARREAGGKGYNLYLMSRESLPVPAWIVLGANVFRKFRASAAISEPIGKILEPLLVEDAPQPSMKTCETIAESIRQVILEAPMPPDILAEAAQAYQLLGKSLIAVRSSAVDEDSAQHSFAGQLSSFLYVRTCDEAIKALRECWASAYSARGIAYRMQNHLLSSAEIEVAVVFQEMIDAEMAGVIFTCDPLTGSPTSIVVNSVYGVGEGLVSGLLDADTFRLEKSDLKVTGQELASKVKKLVMDRNAGGVIEADVPEASREVASLSPSQLTELGKIGKSIEKFYRYPQDVEWAFKDGRFAILQSRPVTTQVQAGEGLIYIWDNSNIVESYGGLTLPLTFGFAHYVYHQVYVQLCEILLVPQKQIQDMEPFLKHMLGMLYGRVYYNILNWYRLTATILPFFKANRAFMETMMGTSHQLADEIADRIKPPGFAEGWSSKLRRTISGFKFLFYHFTAQSLVDKFLREFHIYYEEFRKRDYGRMPASDIYQHYQDLERQALRRWHAPIINDFLVMVHFGLFKKLTEKWLSQLGQSIQNDLLCGNGNLESAEPTRELIRMAGVINQDSGLRKLIEETAPEDCLEALHQSPFRTFRDRVDSYIDKYGHRCMSEMKLEQRDLHMEPAFLFVCLKNYLRSGQYDLAEYEKREHEIRSRAEEQVFSNLRGLKKVVYSWSLHHARKAVRNRENTRFCRTRVYGVVRSMFYGIGNDYCLRGIIDRPEDIFYLELTELYGSLDGTLTCQNFKALVETRKKEYENYAKFEPASRIVTRGPVYWQNEHGEPPVAAEELGDLPPNCLKGTGACPGVVEGIVKVIMEPGDDMELNGEILVTMRTDPGWIPLYPSLSGILVERGGLLSHSAIVAREMGLPIIVGVRGLCKRLESGMRIRFDGQSGIIEILE